MPDPVKMFPGRLFRATQPLCGAVPPITQTHRFIDDMISLFFPVRMECSRDLRTFEKKWEKLQIDLRYLLKPLEEELPSNPEETALAFFREIPLIHARLLRDADRFRKHDPAAHRIEEVLVCYPGFYAISIHRLAHVLYKLGVPVLPRMISEYAHASTGIDIHPGATIGEGFYIDHGTGIVIGETTTIGKEVKIYQGVTLGARYVKKDLSGIKRHPTIEDRVIIYAGSTILGGDTVIGHDTIIGGNVWLTESVPPYSMVSARPVMEIRNCRKRCEGMKDQEP